MIIRGKEFALTRHLTEAEKQLGVDLKLTNDGDLELNNLGDFKLVSGGANAAQAASIKLGVEPGGLVYHPNIGTDLQIGGKTKNAFLIKTQVIKSLSQDPRFENVDAKVTVIGDITVIDVRISLKNSGIQVPLQFVVP